MSEEKKMDAEKNGKVKVTFEVEVNEALMDAAKSWRPGMGWMGPWRGMGPWKGHGMMGGGQMGGQMGEKMGGYMPWGMGHGMECPACGEPMSKPSKEEVMEMLERRKKRLEAVLEHINMEIEKLKENIIRETARWAKSQGLPAPEYLAFTQAPAHVSAELSLPWPRRRL